MVDKRITELTDLAALAANDLLVAVDDPLGVPETKKVTWANLVASMIEQMTRITELTDLTSLSSDDILPVVDDPGAAAETKKVTWGNVIASITDQINAIKFARERLTANRTYYVRTDGNDSNTGLIDSAAGAFKTIQKAVDTIANTLDIAGYTVTVQVRDGTYTGAVNLKNVVGFAIAGNLVIQGNSGTPANVIISTTSADCFNANGLNVTWDIKDMKLQTTTSGCCLNAAVSSVIRFSNIVFGATANYHINAENGGSIVCIGNYSISDNAFIHMMSNGNGYLQIAGVTVTFLASVAFSYFAYSTFMGFLNAYPITFSLGAYSVTGTRYYASVNSAIQTNGGGANYFPGDAPGGTAAGGQYV